MLNFNFVSWSQLTTKCSLISTTRMEYSVLHPLLIRLFNLLSQWNPSWSGHWIIVNSCLFLEQNPSHWIFDIFIRLLHGSKETIITTSITLQTVTIVQGANSKETPSITEHMPPLQFQKTPS